MHTALRYGMGIFIGIAALIGGWLFLRDSRSSSGEPLSQEVSVADIPAEASETAVMSVDDHQGESSEDNEKGADSSETEKKVVQPVESSEAEPETQKVVQNQTKKTSSGKKTAKADSALKIEEKLVDFGYAAATSPRIIDTIILHSSYDASGSDPYSVKGIIDQWKGYDVAPHYFVARDGKVYQLVRDENIAYHAGVSEVPDGRKNVNDFSLGIEIANTKTDQYTDEQYAAIKQLIAVLKSRYAIKYVLGHDDIAPGRKTDPWNFDWKKL